MLLIDLLVQELPKRGGWPDGATRCVQDGDGTVRFDRHVSSMTRINHEWILNGQYPICGFKHNICDDWGFGLVDRKQYEAALKLVWDGTGVPPIGTECTLAAQGRAISVPGLKDGDTVKVIAHFLNHNNRMTSAVTYKTEDGEILSTCISNICLQPIRTERDKFVDSVSEILKPSPIGVDVKLAAVKLWNAGYRKV